jgi:hypothetical protein
MMANLRRPVSLDAILGSITFEAIYLGAAISCIGASRIFEATREPESCARGRSLGLSILWPLSKGCCEYASA